MFIKARFEFSNPFHSFYIERFGPFDCLRNRSFSSLESPCLTFFGRTKAAYLLTVSAIDITNRFLSSLLDVQLGRLLHVLYETLCPIVAVPKKSAETLVVVGAVGVILPPLRKPLPIPDPLRRIKCLVHSLGVPISRLFLEVIFV